MFQAPEGVLGPSFLTTSTTIILPRYLWMAMKQYVRANKILVLYHHIHNE
jgi:hypothetical protein